ncbi:Arylsulfatase [Polystyrenella longa]|uniref:Arylsulfatase n=1 Tax=Polystyrenella longa TaxID=2528007 RepID=A0A518CGI6_9PLAN|nr:arylsulfatase [Polystyrenella longa]QDU78341.1 Arylsulfatase [Polystyrenella longa]
MRILFRTLLLLVLILPVVSSDSLQSAEKQHAEKPNVIFIMADDLGYGDLGCYGQQVIQTPNIDKLAKEGMLFEQYYSGSTVCAPSRCVLMTGLHTGHCHIRGNVGIKKVSDEVTEKEVLDFIRTDTRLNLPPEEKTVAEVLKEAGYQTGLFGKWGLGQENSTGLPTRQGFDEFFGYLDQKHAHNYYPTFLIHNEERVPLKNIVPNEDITGAGKSSNKVEYSHDLIVDRMLQFVDEHHSEPFFLYWADTIPHANNEARDEGMEVPDFGPYADKDWSAAEKGFAAMVTRLDTHVGELMKKLRELRIDDNTIVFFTSDNGPHKEGGRDADFFDSNGPLRGIKRALYDGGIRVPMLVRWPRKIKAGSRSDYIGYFADFLPTAAELTAVTTPEDLDGISIVPELTGHSESQPQHEYLYWEFYEQGSRQAVRFGDYKAIVEPMYSDNMEIYNVTKDIAEQHNLAIHQPELVKRAKSYIKEAHTPSPVWTVPKPRRNKNR